jgi:SAM-dependent methyltransferase
MLCVGLDTDAAAPRVASARAARPAWKGGAENALFLAADARSLPPPFTGQVDELRIVLPWASLLHAVLSADARLVADMVRVLRPEGRLCVVVSVVPPDLNGIGLQAGTSLGEPDAYLTHLARGLDEAGLRVTRHRPVVAGDLVAMRSSWARRLGVPERRPAYLLEARRKATRQEPR